MSNDLPIDFETEDIVFTLENPDQVKAWIGGIVEKYEYTLEALTFIFCSDDYLHKINLEYLDHDTLTDIITFDNSDEDGLIEGDIFISIERVRENSENLSIPITDELHRVLIHGVLHLLGFDDTTPELKADMRNLEDKALKLRNF